jgi:CheY-like chemotaxis protein
MAAPTILLVEDNPHDTQRIRDTLQEDGVLIQIHAVTTDSVHPLLHDIAAHEAPRPALILLSLHDGSGCAVLQALKSSPTLRSIPVVVLTGSHDAAEMLHSYDLYANSCVLKPTTDAGFRRTILAIRRFWLGLVVLPVPDAHR